MSFVPPFCPNPQCACHLNPQPTKNGKPWFYRRGTFALKNGETIPRFRCKICNKSFSLKTFLLSYYQRITVSYRDVLMAAVNCQGTRQSARSLGVSYKVIANRISRLTPQTLSLHARFLKEAQADNSLVYDGFESFSFSQYFPNNINLMVGSESMALWGCNFSHLRRKGRMTEAQKAKRKILEEAWKIDPQEVKKSTAELLKVMARVRKEKKQPKTILITDEHKAYVKALKESGEKECFEHIQVPSRRARTVENPLFPINYLDRQARKDQSEHVRETTRMARRPERQMERVSMYLAYHNFCKPFRETGELRAITHAEKAGMDKAWTTREWEDMFITRRFGKREPLEDFHRKIWNREYKNPLLESAPQPDYLMVS